MKIFIGLGIIAFLGLGYILFEPIYDRPPWKVIDPADPRFNPVEFRLQDYNVKQRLRWVLPQLFKVGDSQEYVELMLVKRGGATKEYENSIDAYIYSFKPRNWNRYFLVPETYYNIGVSYNSDGLICLRQNGRNLINDCRYINGKLQPIGE